MSAFRFGYVRHAGGGVLWVVFVGGVGWLGWCVGVFRHAGGGLCLWGFGGVGWCATRRWVAWVVGVGVGFLLAAAHGLPGCPGGFGGCVWWFENSIVCTVLLHHAAMLLVVWWSFDCQSDARPCGTRGGLMGVGVFV